jgi:DNA-binding transcriptional MerR regulator
VDDEPVVTTAVAAKRLGVSVPSLTRWARDGLITPAFRTPGGQYRWNLARLREELRTMPPPGERD